MSYVTIVLSAQGHGTRAMHDDTLPFNTDAELIGVDNRASGCVSHCIDNFEGPI